MSALLLGNAIKASRADDRIVSVKGLCEREVKADNVICPFAYKEGGDDLQQLYRIIEQKNAIINLLFLQRLPVMFVETD